MEVDDEKHKGGEIPDGVREQKKCIKEFSVSVYGSTRRKKRGYRMMTTSQ